MTLIANNLAIGHHKKTLYSHLELSFQPGEIWAIVGRNGCGKTTLLHTLAGLEQPLNGMIKLSGEPIKTLTRKKTAQQIAILLQNYHYPFPLTVKDMLVQGRYCWHDENIAKENLAWLELAALHHNNCQQLSGGEQRRLQIACLLLQDANILILDEPMNHLDIKYQLQFMQHLKNQALQQQKTIILVVHQLNIIEQFCHKVLLLLDNNHYLVGDKKDLFTTEYLQKVFNHPITCHQHQQQNFWEI